MSTRILVAFAAWLFVSPAAAQDIVLDPSLGGMGQVTPGPDYTIPDSAGAYSGDNLFHSFSLFNIPSGGSATFTWGDVPAQTVPPLRVVARVTGGPGARSDLAGPLVSTIPGADFFLLNPGGITVRQGASFDLDDGDFYGGTAHLLDFGLGQPMFFAGDAAPNPLLATAAPSHFGFLPELPTEALIVAPNTVLDEPGQNLTFVGADQPFGGAGAERPGVEIQGFARIANSGATLQIAAAGADSAARIPIDLRDLDPEQTAPGELGNVDLLGGSRLLANSSATGSPRAGSVRIRAEQFVMSGAIVQARQNTDSDAVGPIDIAARDEIRLLPGTLIVSQADAGGRAPDILLRAASVLADASAAGSSRVLVASQALGAADGPAIEIEAGELTLAGDVTLFSRALGSTPAPPGAGTGGRISVRADQVGLRGGAQVSSEASNAGAGGALLFQAVDVEVTEDARIVSTTFGTGAGGAIEVMPLDPAAPAGGSLTLDGEGRIVSRAEGDGPGGAISLETGSLALTDGARVLSEANAGGDGGGVTIDADSVLVSNAADNPNDTFIASIAGTTVEAPLPGESRVKGGDVEIRTRTAEFVAGGQAFARTEGPGDAGSLTVRAVEIRLTGRDASGLPSGFTARALEAATGDGGLLEIDTRVLFVENGAQVSAATFGRGAAGGVLVTASEGVTVAGGVEGFSILSSQSFPAPGNSDVGPGGNLTVTTPTLRLLNGGQITASAGGGVDAPAGEVRIDAGVVEISGRNAIGGTPSGVFSQSLTAGLLPGNAAAGGLVTIRADSLRLSDGGEIAASTEGGGQAGDVVIEAAQVSLFDDARIEALSIETGRGGDGGSIRVEADTLLMAGGSEITARSQGDGNAGNIEIETTGGFEARDSLVTTGTVRSPGGNITVAGRSLYLKDSRIETSVFGGTDGGGDVTVTGADFVTLDGGIVDATAGDGPGGNIFITPTLFLTTTPFEVNGVEQLAGAGAPSALDARSNLPNPGAIEITAPDTDLTSKIERLPAGFLDASALLAGRCGARTERTGSFTVARRRAPQAPPDEVLPDWTTTPGDSGFEGSDCSRLEETP